MHLSGYSPTLILGIYRRLPNSRLPNSSEIGVDSVAGLTIDLHLCNGLISRQGTASLWFPKATTSMRGPVRGECLWENFLPSGHTTYGTTETYHSLKLLLLMIGANEIRGRKGSGS